MEILRVEHLVKTYGQGENQVRAVDDMSFTIDKGEFVAIVGASGSGKSTLLHLLGGVDEPTSGKIYVDGTDIYELNRDKSDIPSSVIAMDANGLAENENKLVSGRLPENTSEILLGNDSIYEDIEVGDEITLSDGETYEVVGKISSFAVKPTVYDNPIIQYMEEPTGDTHIAVTYKNVKNYEEITESIVGEEGKYEYTYNSELLRYQAQAMSGGNMRMIYTMDEGYYKEYLKEQNINYDEDVVILLDQANITTTEDKTKVDEFVKSEDYISLVYDDSDVQQVELAYVRPKEYPMGIVEISEMGILMSQEQFDKYAVDESLIMYDGIYLNADDSYAVENMIREYGATNNLDLIIVNMDEMIKAQNDILLLISIFLYGFIAVIMLVGLTNIFNSLFSNMHLRRKEFATLQSVGMTKKEFSKMITFESISYVAKALFWGIPIGVLGGYGLYKASDYGNVEYTFAFPLQQIVGASIVVFLVVYGIMKTSLGKIAKQNIIETIRQENI